MTIVCDRKFLSLLSVSHNLCLHYQTALRVIVVVFQALNCDNSVTLWVVACQAPLSSAISQSLFKCMSVMLSTISSSATCFSCCLQSFPASGTFPTSQLYASGGQRIGASPLASVLPMNIQVDFL